MSAPAKLQPVAGFEGYYASSDGKIISIRSGSLVELTQAMHKGYLHVQVRTKPGRRNQRKVPVHQLILFAFEGPKPFPKAETRHLNGIATDNRPSNLAWGTRQENAKDAIRHGTAVCLRRGMAHPCCKITDDMVEEIRSARDQGASFRAIGAAFGVDPCYVGRVYKGEGRFAHPQGGGHFYERNDL